MKVIIILKENYGFEPRFEHNNFKRNYEESISQYRNALGHTRCEARTIEIQKKMISVDEELHRVMRTNITFYNSLIAEIEKHIIQNV